MQLLGYLSEQATIVDEAHAKPRVNWLKKWLHHLSTSAALVQASSIAKAAGILDEPGSVGFSDAFHMHDDEA